MTLPITPNPISLQAIATEFGGSSPSHLLDYYAGGAYVPSGTVGYPGGVSTPVPSSGVISLQNFYGSSAVTILQVTTSLTWTVPAGVTSVALLVVGGGGGSGAGGPVDGGGGGGGGGVIFNPSYAVSGTLQIVIGAGGAGGIGLNGTQGGSTRAGPLVGGLIATGGGYGGGINGDRLGGTGGSGGGACGYTGAHAGGSSIAGQGNDGGAAGRYNNGGGGGGYNAAGQYTADNQTQAQANGKGGTGLEILLPANSKIFPFNGTLGTPFTASNIFVGGGGGGGQGGTSWAGYPGNGGGGAGGPSSTTGTQGTIYTGGGGGGAGGQNGGSFANGAAGGSGAVYIIYPTVPLNPGPVNSYDSAVSLDNSGALDGATVTAGLIFNADGTVSAINSPAVLVRNSLGPRWYSTTTAGIGSSYYGYATAATTGTTASLVGTFNSWVSLAGGQSWAIANTPTSPGAGAAYTVTGQISVAIAASPGGPILTYCISEISTVSSDTYVPPPSGGGGD